MPPKETLAMSKDIFDGLTRAGGAANPPMTCRAASTTKKYPAKGSVVLRLRNPIRD